MRISLLAAALVPVVATAATVSLQQLKWFQTHFGEHFVGGTLIANQGGDAETTLLSVASDSFARPGAYQVRLTDVMSGTELRTLSIPPSVDVQRIKASKMELSKSRRFLAIAGSSLEVPVVDLTSWKVISSFSEHRQETDDVVFSNDEKLVAASASRDSTVWVWTREGEFVAVLDKSPGFQIQFSQDDSKLVLLSQKGKWEWDYRNSDKATSVETFQVVRSMFVSRGDFSAFVNEETRKATVLKKGQPFFEFDTNYGCMEGFPCSTIGMTFLDNCLVWNNYHGMRSFELKNGVEVIQDQRLGHLWAGGTKYWVSMGMSDLNTFTRPELCQ